MQNISTRGGCAPVPFSRTLLGGLAPDGGLFLPESYPRISGGELTRWRSLSYPELAFEILAPVRHGHCRRRISAPSWPGPTPPRPSAVRTSRR